MRFPVVSALTTALTLIGGVLLGGVAGAMVNERLPGHQGDPVNIALSLIAAAGGLVVGGAAWGWSMSRITGAGAGGRMTWAGVLGFAPAVVLAFAGLTLGEYLFVEQRILGLLPIHNIFTMLFTPAAALVTGAGGFALCIGAGRPARAVTLAAICALGGGIAFLTVNLTMDMLGWRVGAPGAEQRATMITTALLGNTAAALVGGALVGSGLLRREVRLQARALS